MDYTFLVMDASTVLECIGILRDNGFLDAGRLSRGYLYINPAKEPALEKFEEYLKKVGLRF